MTGGPGNRSAILVDVSVYSALLRFCVEVRNHIQGTPRHSQHLLVSHTTLPPLVHNHIQAPSEVSRTRRLTHWQRWHTQVCTVQMRLRRCTVLHRGAAASLCQLCGILMSTAVKLAYLFHLAGVHHVPFITFNLLNQVWFRQCITLPHPTRRNLLHPQSSYVFYPCGHAPLRNAIIYRCSKRATYRCSPPRFQR